MNQPSEATVLAFKDAVERKNVDTVKALLAEHESLRKSIDEPWFAFDSPALVFAAGQRNRELLDVLLDAGADIDAKSAWKAGGFSPLHSVTGAAGVPDDAIANLLVERGATIDLHSAAGMNRRDLVSATLDSDPTRVNEPGPDGVAPLHVARTPEMAALLLERGADIEQRDIDHNSTPAMWAVEDRVDVLRFLLTRGANPDIFMAAVLDDISLAERIVSTTPDAVQARPGEGSFAHPPQGGDIYVWKFHFSDTVAEVARRRKSENMYTWLLAQSSVATQIVQACRRADLDALRTLLDKNPKAWDEMPARDHVAALCSSPDVIDAVVTLGANVDTLDERGATALHDAAWRGELGRVERLLSHGANAKVRDRNFVSSALGWAEYNERDDVVAYLAKHADLDVADLATGGAIERLRDALDAEPTLVNGSAPDLNPLRAASWAGHVDCVQLLLQRGAEVDAEHPDSEDTALDYATHRGHAEIVRLLKEAGAKD